MISWADGNGQQLSLNHRSSWFGLYGLKTSSVRRVTPLFAELAFVGLLLSPWSSVSCSQGNPAFGRRTYRAAGEEGSHVCPDLLLGGLGVNSASCCT